MARVNFIDIEGQQHSISVEPGQTLMESAYALAIPGIVAECGGACACATCHVYIDPTWLDKLPAMDSIEDTMLDTTPKRLGNSRLSCQIVIGQELDGIVVRVADNDL